MAKTWKELPIEEVRRRVELQKLQALSKAIEAARKTCEAALHYENPLKNVERIRITRFPPPKNASEAARYHEMRKESWDFLLSVYRMKLGKNGDDSVSLTIEDLVKMDPVDANSYLDNEVKAKRMQPMEANEKRRLVQRMRLKNQTKLTRKGVPMPDEGEDECPI